MITVSTVAIFTTGLVIGAVAGYGVPFLYNKYRKTGKLTTPANKEAHEKEIDKVFEEVTPLHHPDATASAPQAANVAENTAKPDKPATLPTGELRIIANSAEEENLKMLLLDRLDEIEEENADFCQQALCAVLLIDELRQMQGAYTGQNAQCIKDMLYALQEELSARECEILNSDTWTPEIQKIGKVEYTLPNGATPVITAKLASGLRLKGRIIKKQIVALNKSSL